MLSAMHHEEDTQDIDVNMDTKDTTGALGTFPSQLPVAPIQESQDKGEDYGLERLQCGRLKEGRHSTINQTEAP